MLYTKKNGLGILGGSFDPPHKGHLIISKISLKKLRIKKVYWILTKKNPFKKKSFYSLKEKYLVRLVETLVMRRTLTKDRWLR